MLYLLRVTTAYRQKSIPDCQQLLPVPSICCRYCYEVDIVLRAPLWCITTIHRCFVVMLDTVWCCSSLCCAVDCCFDLQVLFGLLWAKSLTCCNLCKDCASWLVDLISIPLPPRQKIFTTSVLVQILGSPVSCLNTRLVNVAINCVAGTLHDSWLWGRYLLVHSTRDL